MIYTYLIICKLNLSGPCGTQIKVHLIISTARSPRELSIPTQTSVRWWHWECVWCIYTVIFFAVVSVDTYLCCNKCHQQLWCVLIIYGWCYTLLVLNIWYVRILSPGRCVCMSSYVTRSANMLLSYPYHLLEEFAMNCIVITLIPNSRAKNACKCVYCCTLSRLKRTVLWFTITTHTENMYQHWKHTM